MVVRAKAKGMSGVVYAIVRVPPGGAAGRVCYVGRTTGTLEEAWAGHRAAAATGDPALVHAAMREGAAGEAAEAPAEGAAAVTALARFGVRAEATGSVATGELARLHREAILARGTLNPGDGRARLERCNESLPAT